MFAPPAIAWAGGLFIIRGNVGPTERAHETVRWESAPSTAPPAGARAGSSTRAALLSTTRAPLRSAHPRDNGENSHRGDGLHARRPHRHAGTAMRHAPAALP